MKKDNQTEIFYSKIMLFGEYSILKGSMGLTIPYAHFNGALKFINKDHYTNLDFARYSNQQLKAFWSYLNQMDREGKLLCNFHISHMKEDLDSGLYFESTIPEGYGLGSSGALVAALYHRYVTPREEESSPFSSTFITPLKAELAQLESYFHGTSSGIDPLICFLKHPLLLKDLQYIEPVGIPSYHQLSDNTIFLLNSGKPWKTAPLVDSFMDRYQHQATFKSVIDDQLTPQTNECIQNLITHQLDLFFKNLKQLSQVQLSHLNQMIPESIASWWADGIASNDYYLKLCGSGGGGFVLGFTKDYMRVKEKMRSQGLEIIPVYQDRWDKESSE